MAESQNYETTEKEQHYSERNSRLWLSFHSLKKDILIMDVR